MESHVIYGLGTARPSKGRAGIRQATTGRWHAWCREDCPNAWAFGWLGAAATPAQAAGMLTAHHGRHKTGQDQP